MQSLRSIEGIFVRECESSAFYKIVEIIWLFISNLSGKYSYKKSKKTSMSMKFTDGVLTTSFYLIRNEKWTVKNN